jgi:lipopolysaccharide export system permease protein
VNILQRYIFREWFWTLLAVSVVLWIVLTGVFIGELLNDIADGRVPAGLLGKQLLLATPEMMSKLLPLSAFVAVMWGLGRLYRDQEMVVMRSNGFSWRNLLRPLFVLVVPVASVLLVITLWAAPKAAALSNSVLEEALRSASLWGLQAGRFQIMQSGRLVLYVEQMDRDGRTMTNVFVRQVDDERTRVWSAREGAYWVDAETGRRFLTLTDGQVTDARPNGRDVRVLRFERNDLQLPDPPQRDRDVGLESAPLADLLDSQEPEARAELQWRFSPAIAVVVLALLAIPLSHSAPREGRGGRVALGILVYAVYANLLNLGRAWVAAGTLPAFVGLWWVHGVVLLLALLWLQRQGRMVGSS